MGELIMIEENILDIMKEEYIDDLYKHVADNNADDLFFVRTIKNDYYQFSESEGKVYIYKNDKLIESATFNYPVLRLIKG